MHPHNAGYEPGNYWAVCDRCGVDHRIDKLKTTWDGLLVCEDDWETRHPQEFLRVTPDTIAPQGEIGLPPPDSFISVEYILPMPEVPDGTFNNGFIDPDPGPSPSLPSDIENDLIINLDEELLFTDSSDNNLDWGV